MSAWHNKKNFLIHVVLVGIILGIIGGGGLSLAAEQPVSFSDLSVTDQNYRYLEFMQNRGILNGYPDGTLKPEASLTRVEAAKMIVLLGELSLEKPQTPTFTDINSDHWAYQYVETAVEAGWFNGYPDGSFQPGKSLTRAEAGVFIERLSGEESKWQQPSLVIDTPEWAQTSINVVVDAGLLGVDQQSRFYPERDITRGEFSRAAALLTTLSDSWRNVPLNAQLLPGKGETYIQHAGDKKIVVTESMTLSEGDKVITDRNSQAELLFDDGSGLLLEENTELEIIRLNGSLFIKPSGEAGSAVEQLEIKIDKGQIFGALAVVGEHQESADLSNAVRNRESALMAYTGGTLPPWWPFEGEEQTAGAADTVWWKSTQQERVRVKVDMPWGVAGIRGTFWKNEVTPTRNSTSVLSGKAVISSAGGKKDLGIGQQSQVTSNNRPPSQPQSLTLREKQSWTGQNRWVRQRVDGIRRSAPGIPRALDPSMPLGPNAQQPGLGRQVPKSDNAVKQVLQQLERTEREVGAEARSHRKDDDDDQDTQPPTVSVDVSAGTYNSIQTVTLAAFESADIYFTIDSSTPTTDSLHYSEPITIGTTTTLKFFAVDEAGNESGVSTIDYTIDFDELAILTTDPTDGSSGIAIDSLIVLSFSESVVADVYFEGVSVSGDFGETVVEYTYEFYDNELILTPELSLAKDTNYTVAIPVNAVKGQAGNTFEESYSFSFTTGPAPEVSSTVPSQDATIESGSQSIHIAFNEII